MGNTTNIYCREGGLEPELDLSFGDLPSFLDREPGPRTCYHDDQEQRNSFSSQDFFEFSPPDDQSTKTNPPRDIIFFGRDILNKTKQSANSPDPFIYGTDSRNPVNRLPHLLSRSIETSKPSRAPNSTGSFRDHLSSDSSRKHKVLIGLAKVPSKMELSDIKKRQSRQAPAPMIPAAMLAGDEKRLLMGFDRSGKSNQKGRGEFAKPLKCRTYLSDGNDADTEGFMHSVDGIFQKVVKLERRVNEVEQFYLNISKKQHSGSSKGGGSSIVKDKDKERPVPSIRKQQQDASKREAAAAKRMQELMRQFGTTLRQIAQHKWAWPFMQPVDVKGLGLHDYYEVIDKPMDLSTIKNQMEANDGTGYKNVREICADARLVFKNAMKYNDEKSDVHVMARKLLGKFEEKWLQLLPKVTEEEKRREDEEVEAKLDMQLAQEAAMARDLSNELYEVDMHLEELHNIVVEKCRKMSTEEKRKLGVALTRLSPEDLTKALEIVAKNNPGFQATAEEVDLDIDAQAESTLWLLKFFVKDVLEVQGKSAASTGGNNNKNTSNNNKQKREICNAIAKTAKKRSKKPSS
ncbi:hypothetical protein SADUNF_Sadunf10G0169600 [Salix dunnii]|uniref:Uncharacterized protein n=1 Tax=Salix dunnii TaxID=1413687 RepID=A0A835JUV9_9ROSI|nr:hypothetical protein SADUNF_Sadunf10G0169600 [Salix dunnii]